MDYPCKLRLGTPRCPVHHCLIFSRVFWDRNRAILGRQISLSNHRTWRWWTFCSITGNHSVNTRKQHDDSSPPRQALGRHRRDSLPRDLHAKWLQTIAVPQTSHSKPFPISTHTLTDTWGAQPTDPVRPSWGHVSASDQKFACFWLNGVRSIHWR